jgi:hypothetical protein
VTVIDAAQTPTADCRGKSQPSEVASSLKITISREAATLPLDA